jgi:two-component system, NtrC family, response regulator GlrR
MFRVRVERGAATPSELLCENDRLVIGSSPEAHLVLHDEAVSPIHCDIVPEGNMFVLRDLASKTGTWLAGVQVREVILAVPARLRVGGCEILFEPVVENEAAAASRSYSGLGKLIGGSAAMRGVIDRLARVAERDTALLLEGESGTGKELAAEGVHQASQRSGGPFVVVDCGSIARTLIEAELFGHERGAYTGANQAREGAFVRAHGGTLFLDEIGELDIDLQPRLLGAIERREVKPIGAARPITVDVRIVAATNRDLRQEVARGTFREDLYYRMAVACVRLPPLRERPEDIPVLVQHFLRQHELADGIERVFDDDLAKRLASRPWPGNVRELRNAIEQIVAFGSDDVLPPQREVPVAAACATPFKVAKARVIEQFEREYLSAMLAWKRGNITAAASAAEMDRVHLVRLLDRYGLRRKREA